MLFLNFLTHIYLNSGTYLSFLKHGTSFISVMSIINKMKNEFLTDPLLVYIKKQIIKFF